MSLRNPPNPDHFRLPRKNNLSKFKRILGNFTSRKIPLFVDADEFTQPRTGNFELHLDLFCLAEIKQFRSSPVKFRSHNGL